MNFKLKNVCHVSWLTDYQAQAMVEDGVNSGEDMWSLVDPSPMPFVVLYMDDQVLDVCKRLAVKEFEDNLVRKYKGQAGTWEESRKVSKHEIAGGSRRFSYWWGKDNELAIVMLIRQAWVLSP